MAWIIFLPLLLGLLGPPFGSAFHPNFFKQPNFHLEFNSFYVDDSKLKMYSLRANEILPILDLVSSKFSRIYTQTIYSQSGLEKRELNDIPEAVALLNKQYKRNKIELFMTIHWEMVNSSGVSSALEAANKANSLFPGSVTHLLVNYVGYNMKEIGKETDLHFPLKLGVIISADSCSNAFIAKIKNVQLVILDFGDIEMEGKRVEEYVEDFKLVYERCRKILKGTFINADVGLQFSWLSNSSGNSTDLTKFWTIVNKWSIEDNVKIFMKSAFDDIPAREVGYSIGRWKVISKDRGKIKFKDKFCKEEEELEEFENLSESSEESRKGDQEESNIMLLVGIIFVFIIGLRILLLFRRARFKRLLTRKEMSEFYKGSESFKVTNDFSSIDRKGYNKEFELDKGSFRISDCLLGSGAFGEVWKGTLLKDGFEIEVAAKTLKRGCHTSAVKGFLSEIKVMGYLGKHKNLVGMIGAYTKGSERGKVIVFTELCGRGSLESYLRDLGKSSVEASEIDLTCFHRWCVEIANGMEYLSSRNVVHADLATRNVLLNDELTAKISDFGLSRRLYDYLIYVKEQKQQEPLPWKWMAPESLQRLEFNEKTDVWAFGVTMWEIYSLGNIPYPGLNWTVDFPTKLIKGLRMEKPFYDDGGMYIQMIKCWNIDATKRPTFSELNEAIQSMELTPVHDQQVNMGEEVRKNKTSDNYLAI